MRGWWREHPLQTFPPGTNLRVGGWNRPCPTITAAAGLSAAALLAWRSAEPAVPFGTKLLPEAAGTWCS